MGKVTHQGKVSPSYGNICLQPVSCQFFELNNFTNLHFGISETLIFALNKFSLKARYVPQIKMTAPYSIFLILQIY